MYICTYIYSWPVSVWRKNYKKNYQFVINQSNLFAPVISYSRAGTTITFLFALIDIWKSHILNGICIDIQLLLRAFQRWLVLFASISAIFVMKNADFNSSNCSCTRIHTNLIAGTARAHLVGAARMLLGNQTYWMHIAANTVGNKM